MSVFLSLIKYFNIIFLYLIGFMSQLLVLGLDFFGIWIFFVYSTLALFQNKDFKLLYVCGGDSVLGGFYSFILLGFLSLFWD